MYPDKKRIDFYENEKQIKKNQEEYIRKFFNKLNKRGKKWKN